MNICDSKEYQLYKSSLNEYIKPENLIKVEFPEYYEIQDDYIKQDELIGSYIFNKEYYHTKEKRCWNFTRLLIEYPDGFELSIIRNYRSLPMLIFVHNGKDYVFTGEDYQGITLINLTDRTVHSYIPEAWKQGFGWCVTEFQEWKRDENILVCEGCYWGGDYERRYYKIPDLANPDFEDFETGPASSDC